MINKKQSVEEYHLKAAARFIDESAQHVNWALLNFKSEPLKPVYQTPQWHHTVLWAGFAFITGMLLGAGLVSI